MRINNSQTTVPAIQTPQGKNKTSLPTATTTIKICLVVIIALGLAHAATAKQYVDGKPYILMHLSGRLGNQMFQVAAAESLAIDFGAQAIFPDFITDEDNRLRNYQAFFHSSLVTAPPPTPPNDTYEEPHHNRFRPIAYQPNMEIYGYFQSEKYFKHNKEKILPIFEPSIETKNYLQKKYSTLLEHPNTVAIHMRAYKLEDRNIKNCFPFLSGEFFMNATALFPEENALFVIFSDRIKHHAKTELNNFTRPHVFIENETHYNDLYLMSMCKHQILSTSSFSWWGAYLNKNPNKPVIAPDPWFSPRSHHDSSSVIPEGWRKLAWSKVPAHSS